jgi:hypothetical protein
VVTDLKYNPTQNIVTAGTYGRGAWQVTIGPPTPHLIYESIELPLLELDGDGDDRIEPGESWGVRVILKNAGGEAALDVHATLATATGGVNLFDAALDFGDVASGASAPAVAVAPFTVDPAFPCGESIAFEVVDITSANPPNAYFDEDAAFALGVFDDHEAPVPTTQMDEDFDPEPATGWTHESIDPNLAGCTGLPYFDQWGMASKDAGHGQSYHCGSGAGSSYLKLNNAWLYHAGKDSEDGEGIVIPGDAIAASLTLVHWYDTALGVDGGQVVIDGLEDGEDVYTTLQPIGGYPGDPLAGGNCNALGGMRAFQGSSGGWVTSTFDLLPYKGRKIYLAFVFGSDRTPTGGEGWYIDQVKVDSQLQGTPICQVTAWPGSVASATFTFIDPTTIEASWDASCNEAVVPGQTYSIQAGDLDLLHSAGAYNHDAVAGYCDLVSPSTFATGSGNEYYLVVPNLGGRDGGSGVDSNGTPRPAAGTACGIQREAACP